MHASTAKRRAARTGLTGTTTTQITITLPATSPDQPGP
jgi:hypothetical protein